MRFQFKCKLGVSGLNAQIKVTFDSASSVICKQDASEFFKHTCSISKIDELNVAKSLTLLYDIDTHIQHNIRMRLNGRKVWQTATAFIIQIFV